MKVLPFRVSSLTPYEEKDGSGGDLYLHTTSGKRAVARTRIWYVTLKTWVFLPDQQQLDADLIADVANRMDISAA